MIVQLGHFALILAACLAITQSILPLIGLKLRRANLLAVAGPAAVGQFIMVLLAFLALAYAFYSNDFSVIYVAENSNTKLPVFYRLAAVWGAHEGSLLLWILILSIWSVIVAVASRTLPREISSGVLAIMGLISVGFLFFILFTSNPFELSFPGPLQGRDLNPLLQDPGMISHPPMLYMGYVGFSVAFAFAITALITGRIDGAWTRWTRPWTVASWMFLTIGITMGSWWAYRELGWGGWWFWDPSENASFMPWLVGTALIHSLAVTEVRGIFKSWTVLLAITTFALTILGTFIIRSGVLISVHAFANDPTRGVYILTFFSIIVGSSLVLYAWRAPSLDPKQKTPVKVLSREGLLLLNNIFLTVAAAAVLLGTLYPMMAESMGAASISVGPPYFNSVFIPLFAPLAVLVGLAGTMMWKKTKPQAFRDRLWLPVIATIILAIVLTYLAAGRMGVITLSGTMLGMWTICTAAEDVLRRLKSQRLKLPRSVIGMAFAHAGIGIAIIGITMVTTLGLEQDVRLAPEQSATVAGYVYTFHGVKERQGPNYSAKVGHFSVTKDGKKVAEMYPEKRRYFAGNQGMTEAGISAGFLRDLYVSLGESLNKGAWSVRIYYKPLVRWIWIGGLIAAFGGLLAVSDKRYWKKRNKRKALYSETRRPAES